MLARILYQKEIARTRINIRSLSIKSGTKSPLQFGLDTLLRNSHQISRLQNLSNLSQNRIIARQTSEISQLEFLMAKVLAASGYHYQFVFVRNAEHTDHAVKRQTLPEALEYVWQGYPILGAKN